MLPNEVLEMVWLDFARIDQKLGGEDPERMCEALLWLADAFADTSPDPRYMFWAKPKLLIRDKRRALELFERASQLRPDHLNTQLKVCEALNGLGEKAKRNRLLDDMVKRFPQSKEVLVIAGKRCIERNALVKGLGYLRNARELQGPEWALRSGTLICDCFHRIAGDKYRGKKTAKARELFDELESFHLRSSDHVMWSQWAINLRRGAYEFAYGDPKEGENHWRMALSQSPTARVFRASAALVLRLVADSSSEGRSFLKSEVKSRLQPLSGRDEMMDAPARLHRLYRRAQRRTKTFENSDRLLGA